MRLALAAVVSAFGVSTLAGCAASATPNRGVIPRTQMIEGRRLNLLAREDAVTTTLTASPDRVWEALRAEWMGWGFPATKQDAAAKLLTLEGYQTRRELKGTPMRVFLDCGRASGTDGADFYTITMTFIAQVTPKDAGSEVAIVFSAMGNNPTNIGAAVNCSSTGTLEERFVDGLKGRLGS